MILISDIRRIIMTKKEFDQRKKDVIFTPGDIDELFEIRELIDQALDQANQYFGITSMLDKAFKGILVPTNTADFYSKDIEYAVEATYTLSSNVSKLLADALQKYNDLYEKKRDVCFSDIDADMPHKKTVKGE